MSKNKGNGKGGTMGVNERPAREKPKPKPKKK